MNYPFIDPWTARNNEQKREAVRELVQGEGLTYSAAATRLGTTRLAIAGVVERSRRTPHPIVSSSGQKYGGARGAAGGKVFAQKTAAAKARERKKHAGFHKFVALPQLAVDPEPGIARADAWLPLPGSCPVPLEQHTNGCRWPVGADLPFLYCNDPVAGEGPYCAAHNAIGTRPLPPAVRKKHAARS